jgi:hypothetical protein
MTRTLVLVLAAGCFARPQPHGATDGNSGDGDAVPPDDSDDGRCAWQGPVAIDVPGLQPTDALNGPWLDETRTELWYARFSNNMPPASIYRAAFSAGAWSAMLEISGAPAGYANPFFDETRGTIWFDVVPTSGPRHLGEFNAASGTLVTDHLEATNMLAPSLTTNGATLYTTAAVPFVIENDVSGDAIQTSRPVPNPVSLTFESPSVTSDGTALYVANDGAVKHIYVATLTPAHDGYAVSRLVGAFQMADANYFDPDISRDGTTLVFASDFASLRSRLYYVTRPAGCSP